MDKSNALLNLLTDLAAENSGTSVVTVKNSFALVSFPGEPDGLQLTASECELLFDTTETAHQFYDVLDEPSDTTLELHNVSVEDEVMDLLRDLFNVEES